MNPPLQVHSCLISNSVMKTSSMTTMALKTQHKLKMSLVRCNYKYISWLVLKPGLYLQDTRLFAHTFGTGLMGNGWRYLYVDEFIYLLFIFCLSIWWVLLTFPLYYQWVQLNSDIKPFFWLVTGAKWSLDLHPHTWPLTSSHCCCHCTCLEVCVCDLRPV